MTNNENQLKPLDLDMPIPSNAAFAVDLNERQWKVLILKLLDSINQGGAGGNTPVTANIAVDSTVDTLRNSTLARKVGIYNHGPNRIHVNFGATNAVVDASSLEMAVDDYFETPTPVIGKITAICAAAETATVTVTTF